MSLNDTPRANRLHIGIFGKRNSGKSSLINAITGQEIALVSEYAGTTTDPVYKAMEISGIGPCVFIDTAGFDDVGELGQLRVEKTKKALDKIDVAIMVFSDDKNLNDEKKWLDLLKKGNIPTISVLNKSDILTDIDIISKNIENFCGVKLINVSVKEKIGIKEIRERIIAEVSENLVEKSILGDLVKEDDVVLLVMPQDIQAPKGRLILPQVQTIRELLDKKCTVVCTTTDKLINSLNSLKNAPDLIITDSQAFDIVYKNKPKQSKLTSFSILFANYKGDLKYFVEGAKKIEKLTPNSKVLIAEACTHAPLKEDIGREKIPRMLRKKIGENLKIDMVSGVDFPEDLSEYDLIIHCGGCMFNRKYVLSRVKNAKEKQIPMTNYGVVMAYLNGILDKIDM